ncbi:hypothetical protein [Streptomyces sp. SP18CS02]|uniref:hypothetical protein n=1 Tax=Streptomyces sp. SP18CS02 TaxID=3002531 RepID=UPI002E79F278|nr:hypothetical protein [Streptomyces sp. SP18CS02]MEE1750942.1 hypothetical protein [Streptomyces sp. SP18CS02]
MAVDMSFFKSPIMQDYTEEVRAKAQAQGEAKALLIILEQRGIHISDAARERINAGEDPEILLRWLTRALSATSAEEIFAEE